MQFQTVPLLNESNIHVEKSSLKKLNKCIIPICNIIILLSYMNLGNLSFAANQFCTAINITYIEYGTGASLFYITLVIFQVPSNIILQTIGAPIWLCFLLLFMGLISMAMALVQNVIHYYLLRLLLGLSISGIFPGIYYYITSIYPYKYTSIMFGFVAFAVLLSTPVSSPIAAILLSLDSKLGIAGWQWLFAVEGSFPVVFAIYIYLVLPRDIESTLILNEEEKEYVKSNLLKSQESSSGHNMTEIEVLNVWYQIKSVITSREIWNISLFYFIVISTFTFALYFSTLIISDLLNDDTVASATDLETCSSTELGINSILLTAIPYIIAAVVALVFAKYIHKMKERPFYMAIISSISSISLFLWIFVYENLIVGISTLTLVITGIYGCNFTLVTSFISSKFTQENSAVGFAIFNSLGMIGGLIGPLIAGYIINYFGFFWCILSMACSLLVSVCFSLFMRENPEISEKFDI